MKGAQQVIKGLAIAFAVILIMIMFAALVGAGTIMSRIFGGANGDTEWVETVISEDAEFENLTIKLSSTSLRLEYGDKFEVKADKDVVKFRYTGKRVYIEERDFNFFSNWHALGGEVKVTLPKSTAKLNEVVLDAGAGSIFIDGLIADNVDLNLGAGKVEINNLMVSNKAKISGGAGLVLINDSLIKDVELDMGVGRLAFVGKITGQGDIDAGVGKLELNLIGDEDDYRLRFNKGLGAITLNGRDMGDDSSWGLGAELIKVDGGIGAIEVKVEPRTETQDKMEEEPTKETETLEGVQVPQNERTPQNDTNESHILVQPRPAEV